MTGAGPAAVLFDVDGVLIDSGAAHNRVWSAWAGLRRLDPAYVRQAAQGRRRLDTLRLVAPDLDIAEEHRALDELMAAEEVHLRAYPDAARVLGALRTRWAVVTSSRREATRPRMERLGLPVPEVRICAEDVPYGKPAPDGYLAAAARLGADPRHCTVIEDSPAGIRAGRDAGCTVHAVTTTHTKDQLAEADACFSTLERAVRAVEGVLWEMPG
ncbi:HAD-IA family hydrolase [Actinacidiphila yanglinensis]|nr:HAD-IA family hydrolase [Actinacidiphila yanglinensis]